jgi:hypothetical protein
MDDPALSILKVLWVRTTEAAPPGSLILAEILMPE